MNDEAFITQLNHAASLAAVFGKMEKIQLSNEQISGQ